MRLHSLQNRIYRPALSTLQGQDPKNPAVDDSGVGREGSTHVGKCAGIRLMLSLNLSECRLFKSWAINMSSQASSLQSVNGECFHFPFIHSFSFAVGIYREPSKWHSCSRHGVKQGTRHVLLGALPPPVFMTGILLKHRQTRSFQTVVSLHEENTK